MHSIKYNKIQIIKYNSCFGTGVPTIFRESTNTKFHKSNTPLQVLTALTVTFKISNP